MDSIRSSGCAWSRPTPRLRDWRGWTRRRAEIRAATERAVANAAKPMAVTADEGVKVWFQALQEKHKEAIVEFTAAEQEYNDMLNLDRNDVVIRKAKTESLPADISGEQLMSIWPMIEEEKKNAER